MKKISILFSLVLLASSCVKQMEEPESAKIAGMWVVVDDNDFTTKYIEFEHGNVREYVSGSEKFYVADKSIWACPEGCFKQLSSNRYSLVDGTLHYGSSHQKMRVEGETMSLGEMKCRLVENICPEYYSTVNIFNPTQFFAFNGGNVEWSYNITQPVEGFVLKAKGPDWVSGLMVTADKISFTVPETTTTRTGTITLSYPSAEDLKISVTQLAAEINLDKTSVTLGYAASSSSFTYSIPDPQDGYTLKVEASHDWITDVKDNGNGISFSVKENNSGSSRTGKITLTYGGISKEFTVTQTYSATSIAFTPTSGSHDYTGGNHTFKYTISNPREGQKATFTASDSWITGLMDNNGTVSYTIAENNSGTSRTGKITVTYAGVSKEFTVTQSYTASGISLSPTSGSHDYTSGTYNFKYTISNPREGQKAAVSTSDSWITGVSDSNGTVSYKVAENNSGSSRTGKITVTYAGVSKEFIVTQSYTASGISLSPTSGSHDYTSGTYNFTYTVSNPREGQKATVSTSDSWITGVTDNNGTVSYTVSRNTTGSSRSGKITVKYGDLSKTFTITQSAASLTLSSSSATCTYASASKSFSITISNRQSDLAVSIKSDVSWITNLSESNGTVSYKVAENNSGSSRTGKIIVTYAGVSKNFTLTQSYDASSISFTPTSGSHDYTSGAYTFKYTISNPREGQKATVSTSDSWITGVTDTNGTVSYKVSTNTTGSSRSGKITVKYGDQSKIFTITQSAASLTLSSSSATCTYASASKSFSITISNRQSDLAVSVQSDVSWITGVSESNGTVSYKVAENNSGSSRTGKITVTYGGISKEFVVTQTYSATSIAFTPTSASHDYTSGTYNFKYAISNPREGQKAAVSTSDSWITGVTDSNGTVSYTIAENNSGSLRTGKIIVTYAGINKVFSVTQGKVPVNLSVSGTANCYVVSNAGSYYFKSVKGNSSTSVGTVSSVAVLWESFGTSTTPSTGALVMSVSYKDGNIYFDTAITFKEGNTVIAAKNSSGTILWSWHIWFTDEPQGQEYYNNAGTMMDRNLGATSATPGDVGALGLLYQWGRKDPFLGSSSISDDVAISWPSVVSSDSSNGTIEYATSHPTTFIYYNSRNYDWYYTGSRSTDNTRWTTSDKPKSIYDPCPAGWRVPDGGSNGVWSKALGSSSTFKNSSLYSSSNKGMNFSGVFGSASTIWYPASGYLGRTDGCLYNVGGYGLYWSASPDNVGACYLYLYSTGSVGPSYGNDRAYGLSVRCLQE